MSENEVIRVLLIEDNPGDVRLVEEMLRESPVTRFELTHAESLSPGFKLLADRKFDVLLLDLGLPESQGIETLRRVLARSISLPVIVITVFADDAAGLTAVQAGAQDYLIKGQTDSVLLRRSIRYAIERKRAEEALSKSEQKFRAIFDQTFQFIGLLTTDGTIIEANRTALNFIGAKESDVIGRPFWETPWWTHSAELQETLRAAVKKAAQGEFVRFEATHPAADGRLHSVDFSLKPVMDESGTVVLLIPEGRDITERKQAEEELTRTNEELQAAYEQLMSTEEELRTHFNELIIKDQELRESERRYRDVVEDQTELICRFRTDGIIIFVNDAFCRYFGKNREEMIGHRFVPEIPDEDRPQVRAHFASISPDHPVRSIKHRIRMPDGEVRWQQWSDRAVFDKNGQITEYQSVGRDVTDRKMAEDALILARKKLNFLNVVTFNDIRNSIFSLSGYLELEKELLTDEKVEGYLENEKFAVRSIVHSLNFAKNYQDMGIKPPLWQNVNQTFLYAISHLDFAKVSRILRKVTLDNLEIYADPLLETVFFNLAENVLKHGGAVTEMILRYQEVPEGLTLFFEDNGKGIPVHLKEEIFERGYGKDKGMGLFLVREVLGITRISIRETGQQGKGARFEISVPKGCYRFASR